MRSPLSLDKLRQFLEQFGKSCKGPGTVYLTGGATALMHNFRNQTIDVDLKLEPEPAGAFEAIAKLKESLDINIELSAPDLFLPPLPGWRERSIFISRSGQVDFYHYDPYSQALAKIERNFATDVTDVEMYFEKKMIEPATLWSLYSDIREGLIRYPAVNADLLDEKVKRWVERRS